VPVVKASPRGALGTDASIVHQHGNLDEHKHMYGVMWTYYGCLEGSERERISGKVYEGRNMR
jgi:hypothetical protein